MLLNLGVLKTKYNHFKRREIRVFIINNVIILYELVVDIHVNDHYKIVNIRCGPICNRSNFIVARESHVKALILKKFSLINHSV